MADEFAVGSLWLAPRVYASDPQQCFLPERQRDGQPIVPRAHDGNSFFLRHRGDHRLCSFVSSTCRLENQPFSFTRGDLAGFGFATLRLGMDF